MGVEKVSQFKINIGFDAKRVFHNRTGLGNYSRTLLDNLSARYPNDFRFFLFTPPFPSTTEYQNFLHLRESWILIYPKTKRAILWRLFSLIKDLEKQHIQIYHGLSNELPLAAVRSDRLKWVVSVHDLAFLYFKEDYSFFDRWIHYFKIKLSCAKADLIIAISESTKSDLCRTFSISPDKIKVIYQTVQDGFTCKYGETEVQKVLDEYLIPDRYFLYVGSITARKNLLVALKAWDLLPEELRIPFVIIGKPNRTYLKKIKLFLKGLSPVKRRSLLFREVGGAHLPFIYQKASLFIYPSHFEGFGIPVLEALYSGLPVITGNKSALPEVAGEGAYLVNPKNAEEIRDGILYFMNNPAEREMAIKKGYDHIKKFDASFLTGQLYQCYQDLMH